VELQDASGKFLARGYGNPASLIAFRALSRDPGVVEPTSPAYLKHALSSAAALRRDLGLEAYSHRLVHGEADGVPGLIVARYRLEGSRTVIVVQAHTAGVDRMLGSVIEALTQLDPDAALVIRNDLGVRKLEGIAEQAPRVERAGKLAASPDAAEKLLRETRIRVRGAVQGELLFHADLFEGQKTGFFLDQSANIELAARRLRAHGDGKTVRILDLCTYVGQWGSQLSAALRAEGRKAEVVAVDASEKALELARANIEAAGGACETLKGDVLRDLERLETGSFDWVVCDPPALIKGRKDIPQGTHAYLQVNTQAFRLARRGGAVVSCSCSGLLEEESFTQTLSKAAYRNRADVRWIARGGQAPDHPVKLEFPEGRYLKCWIGRISEGES
jgi:23S rRNA (cytosine1962-C5)-methyltransferase